MLAFRDQPAVFAQNELKREPRAIDPPSPLDLQPNESFHGVRIRFCSRNIPNTNKFNPTLKCNPSLCCKKLPAIKFLKLKEVNYYLPPKTNFPPENLEIKYFYWALILNIFPPIYSPYSFELCYSELHICSCSKRQEAPIN